ncbi:hypothetical protein ACFWJT_15750 [Streptomyces sp. NPDC127069]|uniref:hypothetical protein n=1 Tax=Streptomyces sp. NPDC127069 TaxID=3347128 RepID=UPI00364E8A4A
MLDIDYISPGDELPDGASVACCGGVMDTAGSTWSCDSCEARIEARAGLVFHISD